MSDRLNELQRQRALMQEHLAWLEREIAAATGATPKPVHPAPGTPAATLPVKPAPFVPLPTATQLGSSSVPVPAAADDIIAQYQEPKESLHSSIRRGCFLYFFIALGLLAAGVIVLYLLRTRPAG